MSTVKKALALVLAFALAMTMMAGASFTDESTIDKLDAVNTLVALDIIKGFPDGSFKPDQIVTRAEMAKMIYVLKNGGRDDGATYFKDSVNAFYDVEGHWAEGYVNYCYTLGIIAGKGNGVFDPDGPVTALEAAKMLLVVLGYKPETEGLVGSQWAIKTAALAQSSGLFDGYDAGLGDGAPRQFVAQMIANALDAAIVEYDEGVAKTQYDANNKAITLGSRTVNIKTEEGILVANENYSYDDTGAAPDGKIKLKYNLTATTPSINSYTFDGSDDLVGLKVKIMYKDSDSTTGLSSADKIVGLAALGSNNVVSFIKGSIDTESATQIKMKTTGTKYKLESVNMVYNNFGSAADAYPANLAKASADTVTLIDNDADGYYDVVKVLSKKFSKITAVGSTAVSVSNLGTFTFEDNTIYDGIAKNDYVLIYSNYRASNDSTKEDYTIEKVDPVTYELGGRNSGGDLYVNGAYVSVDKAAYVGGAGSDDFYYGKSTDDIGGKPKLGEDITLYMYGKYWVLAKGEEASDNYCVVTAADSVAVLNPRAKVLFADGTKGTYVVDSDGADATVGQVYTYSINSSDEIKLTAIPTVSGESGLAKIDYSKATDTASVSGVGTKLLSDTTTIFVKNTATGADPVWKALTYGDIEDINITTDTGETGEFVIDGSVLKLATFKVDGGVSAGGSDLTYGFLTANPSYILDDDDDYLVTYTIWDGTTSLTKVMNVGSGEPEFSGKAKKGAFVKFKTKANGEIVDSADKSNVLLDIKADLTKGRIFKVSGSLIGVGLTDSSTTSESYYQVTDDTQIIFVEADDNKSAAAGDITTFDSTKNSETDAFNALFCYNTDTTDVTNDLAVLFIDIDSTILK